MQFRLKTFSVSPNQAKPIQAKQNQGARAHNDYIPGPIYGSNLKQINILLLRQLLLLRHIEIHPFYYSFGLRWVYRQQSTIKS